VEPREEEEEEEEEDMTCVDEIASLNKPRMSYWNVTYAMLNISTILSNQGTCRVGKKCPTRNVHIACILRIELGNR